MWVKINVILIFFLGSQVYSELWLSVTDHIDTLTGTNFKNMASTKFCESMGCKNVANLQCPTCIKLGIQGSFFCSQECFKSNWKSHKIIHSLASK